MKTLIAFFFCAFATLAAVAETPAERAATLIASADTIRIEAGDSKKQEIVFQDTEWIQRVSKAVGAAPISESGHCFCVGWRSFGFYRNGTLVISVAPIHGNQLRIYEANGDSGDFPVDETSWSAVNAALNALHKPPQTLIPKPISVPPAAGVPALGAAHL